MSFQETNISIFRAISVIARKSLFNYSSGFKKEILLQ